MNPDSCGRAHSSWIQIRVDVEIFESAKKNLRIKKYQNTAGVVLPHPRVYIKPCGGACSYQTSSDGSGPFRKRLLTFLKHLGPVYMEVGGPGWWGNPLWWGNPPVHGNSHFWLRLQERWGDPPHVASPIWGPPPWFKQALRKVWPVVESVPLKKKENPAQPRVEPGTSNPNLSYLNLSPLLLHYHNDPPQEPIKFDVLLPAKIPKFRKI